MGALGCFKLAFMQISESTMPDVENMNSISFYVENNAECRRILLK